MGDLASETKNSAYHKPSLVPWQTQSNRSQASPQQQSLREQGSPLIESIDLALQTTNKLAGSSLFRLEGLLPDNAQAFFDHFGENGPGNPEHLQRDLVHAAEECRFADFKSSAPPIEKIALLSATGPNASAFMDAHSNDSANPMDTRHYNIVMRLKLNAPPTDNMPAKCKCGQALMQQAHHLLTCPQLRQVITEHRHNALVKTIARAARLTDATVHVEPKGLSAEGEDRPDLSILMGDHNFSVDVATRHPATDNWAKRGAADNAAKAANQAEVDKHSAAKRKQFSGAFRPFGIETYGRLGEEARSFVKELSSFARHSNPTAHWQVQSLLSKGVSLALQRGNAVAILEGLQRAQVAEQAQNSRLNARVRGAQHANRGLDLS
jgi:hypothetical protein